MRRGTKISRRALLQGLSAAGIALPFFSSMEAVLAAPAKPQKRFVTMFSANGTIPAQWIPGGNEQSFNLKTILAPLNNHKAKLNVIRGLSMIVGGVGDGHQQGMGQLFTGSQLTPGSTKGGCKQCPAAGWAGGISIDQHIANLLEKEAKAENRAFKYKSLEFGVQANTNNVWGRMCYSGRDKPITPMNDPYDTFKQIFAGVGNSNQQAFEELKARRKSILDAVVGELNSLKNKLGKNDQHRLDQHLTGVREVERSVTSSKDLSACQQPTLEPGADRYKNDKYPLTGKLQMKLLVTALVCGITPVCSIQWSRSVSNTKFTWLGINEGHHSISHKPDTDKKAVADLIKINTWYSQQFKYLLDELSQAKEGNGTVLDNTILLWGNELGKGNTHTRNDIPFIMAGNVGNYFKQGRYLNYPTKTPHNHLLVSLAHAYGDASRQTFGHGTYKGALKNIRA